jgi:CHAT domain-containing protein
MPVPTELLNKQFIVVDAQTSIHDVLAQVQETKNLWTYIVVAFPDGQFAIIWGKEVVEAVQRLEDSFRAEGGFAKPVRLFEEPISILELQKLNPIDEAETSRAESRRLLKDSPSHRMTIVSGTNVVGVLAESSRSVKPRTAPAPNLADRSNDVPTRRWINSEILEHDPQRPLQVGEVYTLAFDVDNEVRDSSIAKDSVFTYQYGDAEEFVELTVQVTSPDFQIHTEPQKLKVPRNGRSKNRARFDIEATHNGEGVISALFLKDGNFIQLLTLKLSVGSTSEVVTESLSRPFDAAFSIKPRDIALVITNTGINFRLILTGSVCAEATIPLTMPELDQIITNAREALRRLVNLEVGPTKKKIYQSTIDIPDEVNRIALKHLAETGYLLFQQIFYGDAADAQTRLIGDRLVELAETQQLKIQIVSQQFLLPWGLMYLACEFDPEHVEPDRFLGLKHIIEHIPLQPSMQVIDSVINSKPRLAVSLNVDREVDETSGKRLVGEQVDYWHNLSKSYSTDVIVRETGEAVQKALADPENSDQIAYFYCHAISRGLNEGGGPDASSLRFGAERLSLKALKVLAPTKKPFASAPLVFINACESAELSPLFYGGFVPYFMAKGARGVIGTECEIPALFARHWASRFFDRFLDGQSLGNVFLELRQEFFSQHNNLLGLLYAVYCDGDTRIAPPIT